MVVPLSRLFRAWAWLAVPPLVLSLLLAWPVRGWVVPYAKTHVLGERGLLADGSFDLLEKAMRDPISKSLGASIPVVVLSLIAMDLFLSLAVLSLSPTLRSRQPLEIFPRFLSVRAVELSVFFGFVFGAIKVGDAVTLSNDRTTDLVRLGLILVTSLLLGLGRGASDIVRVFLVREGTSIGEAARSAGYLLRAQPKWFLMHYGTRGTVGGLLLGGIAGGLVWHPPSYWSAAVLVQLAVFARYALRVSWLAEAIDRAQPVRENWGTEESLSGDEILRSP